MTKPAKLSPVPLELGQLFVPIRASCRPDVVNHVIQPDTGGKDVFVHISAVERAGLSSLNEGAKVSYEVVANRGKESAENLRVG
jgi:cold shock protein